MYGIKITGKKFPLGAASFSNQAYSSVLCRVFQGMGVSASFKKKRRTKKEGNKAVARQLTVVLMRL